LGSWLQRLFRHILKRREPRDFVGLYLQEVGVLGGFHACGELSELVAAMRAVFIEQFFVEDQRSISVISWRYSSA